MATQTVQIAASSGLSSVTLKIFDEETDTLQASVSATAGTNDPSLYSGAFTDAPASRYRAVLFSGSTPVSTDHVTLTLTTDTFPVEGLQQSPTAASIADAVWDEALSGHNLAGSTGKAIRQVKEGTITIEASIDDTSATTTSFVTNLTESTTSYYSNKIMVFISGSLSGQARIITNYNGTTKAITLEEPLTSAPANGDEFLILATHENSIAEIQSGLATAASITALNDISVADVLASVLTESYATDGAAPTLTQAVMLILQHLSESSITGTTKTVKQLDGSTTAATFTLDDASSPSSITRAT